jgi:nitric oxide dioxygenase
VHTALGAMPGREIILIHGCLNKDVQPFKDTIDTLNTKHSNLTVHYRYSDAENGEDKTGDNCSGGFVDAALIENLVPSRHADYYFCGPKPFMVNIFQTLKGWQVPDTQMHFEFFGPLQNLQKQAT